MSSDGTKKVIEIIQNGIEMIKSALAFYGIELDDLIPWSEYEETVKELNLYRDDFSNESGQLVSEVKTLLKNVRDSYFNTNKDIFQWCGITIQLLAKYLELFLDRSSDTYETQRSLLMEVLDDGLTKISTAQDKLQQNCMDFNNVAGKLKTLHNRLNNASSSKSSYFRDKANKIRTDAYVGASLGISGGPFTLFMSHSVAALVVEVKLIPGLQHHWNEMKKCFEGLKTTIEKVNGYIESTKSKLRDEVKKIGYMKTQTAETRTLIALDELGALRAKIVDSVNSLIAQCIEY